MHSAEAHVYNEKLSRNIVTKRSYLKLKRFWRVPQIFRS